MTTISRELPVLEVHLSGDASGLTSSLVTATAELATIPVLAEAVVFARPAEIPAPLLAIAERMWDAPPLLSMLYLDDQDDLLATLLGLDLRDEHDELTRCEAPGCGAWFWADDGGDVWYQSGKALTMCDVHAVADDPGARVFPGPRLEAAWREQDAAQVRARIRATGCAW